MSWLLALPWMRRLGIYVAAVGAFIAALAALRRSGERSGRLQEQLEQGREVSDARQRRRLTEMESQAWMRIL